MKTEKIKLTPVGALALFMLVAGFFYACGSSSSSSTQTGGSSESAVYPMFADDNSNRINDYFEAATHDAGSSARTPGMGGSYGHAFVDSDNDGVCDFAQNGSNTWHGPGFIDEDRNGVCDYWEEDGAHYNQNGGMMWADQNRNGVNDYFERQWHEGYGHDFIDEDNDGVCDYAQDGMAHIWHGPGYVDSDSDGVCDYWQSGGRGHGGPMGHGPHM